MPKAHLKIGKYKRVFKGIYFEVRRADARFPSGKIKKIEQVEIPPWVLIFAFDEKGRVLLTREYKARQKKYFWNFPGGRVLGRKNPKLVAGIQLEEEAGVKAKEMKLFATIDFWQSIDWKRHIFIAKNLTSSRMPKDEGEDIRVYPTSVKKVFQMALSGKIENEAIVWAVIKLHREWKKVKKWLR